MSHRIALVAPNVSQSGGLGTLTWFLHGALARSGRYQAEVISIATSASDPASVRIRAPESWRRGVQVRHSVWRDLHYRHVGAFMSELEVQRYRPRRALTNVLQEYDLVQFVVGAPPWVCAAAEVDRPVLLWTATTSRADRASRTRRAPLPRRAWSSAMLRLVERYERRALRQADVVFALSDYTLANVRPMVSPGEALLAPCGVDTDLFRPAATPSGSYILSVARFSDERKNVRLLLQAYSLLCRGSANPPDLLLAGQPPSAEAQHLIERLGISGKVRVEGVRQLSDLADLYRNAQFFCLSSDEEGLGIVLLEAMASGLPVVSTRCGGPSTAVVDGETGFLIPVGDAEALAEAMQKLLGSSTLQRRMGQAGRTRAEESFSLAATSRVFLDKYDQILHAPGLRLAG